MDFFYVNMHLFRRHWIFTLIQLIQFFMQAPNNKKKQKKTPKKT